MVNFNLSTLLLAVLGTASLATAGPSCNQMPDKKAVASDAARAIDIIRTWGDQPCFVGTTTSISKHGRAEIIAVYGRGGDTTISCNEIAKAAGRIMDTCTRGGLVQGQESAGQVAVHIVA